MADFVIVNGEPVALPKETEADPAARAAFIAKALAEKPTKASTVAPEKES